MFAAISVNIGKFRSYSHPNYLNTPRLVADSTGTAVWKWDQQEPFGNDTPNGDPGNTGTVFDLPLRFPGQYADKETNLNYNMARDYDSAIGRFTRADPLGLNYHLNLYSYANFNPLLYSDPTGEAATLSWCVAGPVACAVGATAAVGSLIWAASSSSEKKRASRLAANIIAKLQGKNCPDDDDNDPCAKQEREDEETCSKLPWQNGVRSRCYASAAIRYSACKSGSPIPDLVKR